MRGTEGSDELTMHWMKLEEFLGKTISYSQNYEDILLSRVFRESEGLYIDVGANHPVFHSVTKLFYDRGWRGINIEPSPVVFAQLVEGRPEDINLNVGIASSEGTLTFHQSLVYHGWSTFVGDLAAHYRAQGVAMEERSIPVTTLANVCREYVGRPIDFLKIDAEGFEREVLIGADFSRWRPRVLVIENSWPESWQPLLGGIDYLPAAFDGLNRFYVRSEDKDLLPAFETLPNVLDGFVPYEHYRLVEQLCRKDQELSPEVEKFPSIRPTRSAWIARKLHAVAKRLERRAG